MRGLAKLPHLLLNCLRLTCVLAFIVIIVGAYTRLSNAGLSCPDWPGCYGQLLVPAEINVATVTNEDYLKRPLDRSKAWIEMTHRYVAGILGILILLICSIAWIQLKSLPMRVLSTTLLVLVIFQALLGMWTVTLLLKPLVVTLHLLGGMLILGLLYWSSLIEQDSVYVVPKKAPQLFFLTVASLAVLMPQIALGAWTSSNYAALVCPDFPGCHGSLWPQTAFKEAFILWRGLGIDYEGGVLDSAARATIHMTHRLGALATFVIIISLVIRALKVSIPNIRLTAIAILILLTMQIMLGVANVLLQLPLPIAVAHNGVAALLLLAIVRMLHYSIPISHSA